MDVSRSWYSASGFFMSTMQFLKKHPILIYFRLDPVSWIFV